MMTPTIRRETAKIYEFPRRPALSGSGRGTSASRPGASENSYPTIEFGSSWYHEAAIQEAVTPRKS